MVWLRKSASYEGGKCAVDPPRGIPFTAHLPWSSQAGDAGGMNVYVRALAMALAESGVEVEIFTRSTKAGQAAVEHPDPACASTT